MPSSSSFPPQFLHRTFKSSGLYLSSSCVAPLQNLLAHESRADRTSALDSIIKTLKSTLDKNRVELFDLENVVERLTRDESDEQDQAIELISAFDSLPPSPSSSLHPGVGERAEMFQNRYKEVMKRVQDNEVFQVSNIGRSASENGIKFDKIGALLGRPAGTSVFLLCLITPGRLEDDTGSALASYSPDLNPTDGYVTENSIVLVEGRIKGQSEGQVEIEVKEIHHPPYANRKEPEMQTKGKEDQVRAEGEGGYNFAKERAKVVPTPNNTPPFPSSPSSQMVIVMAEVNLDSDRVMENVMKVLTGFEDMLQSQLSEDPTFPPPVVVMMGSFTSKKSIHTRSGRAAYRGGWSRLSHVISLHPTMASRARFVFIPGSNDPTPAPLPQMPIPEYFTGPIRDNGGVRAHFASNPCRLKFAGREVVFFNRPSLAQSLSSSASLSADPGTGDLEHTFKTVLDQGHLSPLPLDQCPVYWNLDRSLSLSPPPHGLVLGASAAGRGGAGNTALHYSPDPERDGTHCVETGRFDLGDGEFVCYYPETGEAEFSSVG